MWVHKDKEARARHQASSVSLCLFFSFSFFLLCLETGSLTCFFQGGSSFVVLTCIRLLSMYCLTWLLFIDYLGFCFSFSVPGIFFPVSLIKFYSSHNWDVHERWLNAFHQTEIPTPTPNHRQPRLFRHRASIWLVSKAEQLCLWWCKLSLVCHTC